LRLINEFRVLVSEIDLIAAHQPRTKEDACHPGTVDDGGIKSIG
jgi:hypothetical protein